MNTLPPAKTAVADINPAPSPAMHTYAATSVRHTAALFPLMGRIGSSVKWSEAYGAGHMGQGIWDEYGTTHTEPLIQGRPYKAGNTPQAMQEGQ